MSNKEFVSFLQQRCKQDHREGQTTESSSRKFKFSDCPSYYCYGNQRQGDYRGGTKEFCRNLKPSKYVGFEKILSCSGIEWNWTITHKTYFLFHL